MRLRRVSTALFALVAISLGMTAALVWLVGSSYERVVAAQDHRQRSLGIAERVHREIEQMSRFVRAYTATGEPRYLLYYYDIVAIRDGEKPPPDGYDSRTYWDDVVAGRAVHRTPDAGPRRSFADLMRSQGFGGDELRAWDEVVAASRSLAELEQVAFAATQGLYSPETREFVSDGTPRLDFAGQVVHGTDYGVRKAALTQAVDALVRRTDERTAAELDAARERLQHAIGASVAVVVAAFAAALFTVAVIRRQVLGPIHALSAVAGRLAGGDFSARARNSGGVEEIEALGATLDGMAQAVQDDIARRASVQAELEAARAQAEDATRAKSMFLANMSHEIRTPMNAMIGMAYLALRTEMTPRQRDYVTKVYHAARSLLGIINDILDFSKIEAGKVQLEQVRFRIEDVVGNSVALLRERAHEKDIELLLDITDPSLLGADGALVGDAMRIGQVLTNLLSNAVKFTRRGYVKLSVGIDAHDDGGRVVVSFAVADSGIGMTLDQVARLFQEFTQADGSTTRRYGGSGLGLAISKRYVELMGGRIDVSSEAGVGTRFVFALPLPLASPPAAPATPPPAAASMRVLVVDDQADARQSLVDMLRALQVASDGGVVATAVDGGDALAQVELAEAEGAPFDLLLVDWVMPGVDGAGVLRALASRPPQRRPRVVVVSAYDSDSMHVAATGLGAVQLLPKPVLPESLRHLFGWLGGAEVDTAPTIAAPEADRLSGMRVLVAEDNEINRQVVVELLEQSGVEVVVAANGLEAVERVVAAPSGHFDVVLMDLQMPVLDGYEAARRIRMSEAHFGLPIVALSAHALTHERERCRLLGMNGHVSKPIDPEGLLQTLARLRSGDASPQDDAVAGHAPPPPAASPAAHAGTPASAAEVGGWFERLSALLRDGDIEAIDLWRDRPDPLPASIDSRTADRIGRLLGDYDLAAAFALLSRSGIPPVARPNESVE